MVGEVTSSSYKLYVALQVFVLLFILSVVVYCLENICRFSHTCMYL